MLHLGPRSFGGTQERGDGNVSHYMGIQRTGKNCPFPKNLLSSLGALHASEVILGLTHGPNPPMYGKTSDVS